MSGPSPTTNASRSSPNKIRLASLGSTSERGLENPVLTVEALVLVQARRTQGRAERPGARGEDRSYQQQLGMLPNALGEEWRKGGPYLYHLWR
jgi:hypothetical protein